MERVIPGAVYIDHGARLDEIIPTKLDRGGSINMICTIHGVSQNCNAGECTSGYLVEVAKVTGDEYEGWRRDYPEVFTRPYDPAAGVRLSAWVEGDTL
jgi:trimethylamine-N-oxide reductase (cytochrome c)